MSRLQLVVQYRRLLGQCICPRGWPHYDAAIHQARLELCLRYIARAPVVTVQLGRIVQVPL